jgi:hypothetical protein
VLLLADAMDALNPLLIELLPEIEAILVRAYLPGSGNASPRARGLAQHRQRDHRRVQEQIAESLTALS